MPLVYLLPPNVSENQAIPTFRSWGHRGRNSPLQCALSCLESNAEFCGGLSVTPWAGRFSEHVQVRDILPVLHLPSQGCRLRERQRHLLHTIWVTFSPPSLPSLPFLSRSQGGRTARAAQPAVWCSPAALLGLDVIILQGPGVSSCFPYVQTPRQPGPELFLTIAHWPEESK